MATKVTNGLDLSSQKIVNVADPTADQDAATKKYVDDKGARYKVTLFSSSGSWTVDTNAQFVDVYCFAGGNGGNSGRWTSVSGTFLSGGSGGSGGAANHLRFPAGIFSTSVPITIGSGGAGGVAVTAINTTVNGSLGGNSTFGDLLSSSGGGQFGGNGGNGGTPNSSGGTAGATGGKASAVFNYDTRVIISETLANWSTGGAGGAASQPVGGTGGQPSSVLSEYGYGNAGGGGGGATFLSSTTVILTGGKGGKGGVPSGGGGGGGSVNRGATGTKGGDGGDGGDGAVVVVEWLK